jgi:hypothetical protein
MDRYEFIRLKLEEAHERFFGVTSFFAKKMRLPPGAERHGFRRRDAIGTEEVAVFEHRHGIRVPTEYREFLVRVSNGGAGPFDGLLALNQWDAHAPGADERYLRAPCKLIPELSQNDWDTLDVEDELLFAGSMALSFQGGTYYSTLILNGTHAGRICNIDIKSEPPIFSPFDGFLDWYESWLDACLRGDGFAWTGYPE